MHQLKQLESILIQPKRLSLAQDVLKVSSDALCEKETYCIWNYKDEWI